MAFPSNSQFTALSVSNQPYFDHPADQTPISTDLVGDSNFPSFYFAYDGTNVYFRLRVNGDPRNTAKTAFQNFVWGVLFNTTGAVGTYQWLLNTNGKTGEVQLIQNTNQKVNTWNDPAEGTNGQGAPNYAQKIVNFDIARVTLADSNFSGNADYFIDILIPASTLFSFLGINENTPLQLIPFTSADANNFNKDSLRIDEGFQFANALSDPVTTSNVSVKAKLNTTKTLLSGPSTVTAGALATYSAQITVANTGKSQATTIFVKDLIGLDTVSNFTITSTSVGNTSFNQGSKTLSWNVGNLNAGATATLTFNVTGIFTTSGSRTLETATATGIDSFSGNQIPPSTAATTINVQAAGGIVGRVSDSINGLPLSGVTVQLTQNGNPVATTTTDSNGNYSFTNVVPGSYTLTFSTPNYTTVTQQVNVTGGNVSQVSVLLPPLPGTVTGTVTGNGGPIANASVVLNNSFGVMIAQTTTDVNGSYTFPNVTPGNYNISVSAPSFQSASSGVSVSPNQTVTVNFTLAPSPATVQGTVTDPSGNPLSGVLVEVLNTAGIVMTNTTTNGAGQYSISQLAPGTYRFRFTLNNFSTQILGITLSPGETDTLDATLTPDPGTLTGTVTNAFTGTAIANANVRVLTSGGVVAATTATDATGSYTVSSLSPGTYSVIFSADGYGSQTLSATIQANQTTNLNATLSRLTGTLTGTVVNSNGDALIGAVVNVFQNNVAVASAVTDQSGSFTIPNLTPGNYSVLASARNFGSDTLGATIQANAVTTLSFQLQPSPGAISGTVTDNGGNSLAGAAIVVRDSTSNAVTARTLTDDDGNYTVLSLAPGSYTVTVSADNFQTATQGAIVNSGQGTPINFSLSPNPATITGTVTNSATGQPIPSAAVEVRITSLNGNVIASTFTDPNGNYVVQNLAAGTYGVVISATNFQTGSATVMLSPGETANINIALLPSPGTISGNVFDAQMQSNIPGATVKVSDANGFLIKSVLTDSDGNYTVSGLAPGNYSVTAIADNFQQSTVGAIVQANLTTTVNIGLQENDGSISGFISPALGGANVQLFTADNIFVQSTITGPDGTFQFNSLMPSQYIVTVSASNYQTAITGVTVLSNQTVTTSLNLTPNPATISGMITSVSGESVPTATVKVLDANETIVGTGSADLNGNYSIGNLPPGTYSLVITAPNFSTQTGGITLSPGESQTGVNFQLEPNPGAISGQVTDTNGNPITGVVILVRTSDGALITSAVTSPSGNYLVTGLTPGSYIIVANTDSFSTESVGAIVVSNQTTSANLILTSTVGNVTGSVVDQNGNPITGNNIQIKLLDNTGALLRSFVAEPDGTFSILGLAPDRYLISASADNFTANTVPVDVTANTTTPLSIPLSPAPATLTGRVVDQSSGTGIPGAFVILNTPEGIFIARDVTGDNGNFSLTGLPSGNFVISTSAPDFGSDAATVILNPNQTTNVTLGISPTPGSLQGFVTDAATGLPISGSVVIVSTATGAEVTNVTSDGSGQFLVPGIDPGNYRAVVTATDFTTSAANFTIVSNQTTKLSFALSPLPGTVQGTVTDQVTGQPIAGATVVARLLSPSGPIIASTLTDSNGMYVITGLAPTTYTLVTTAPNFGTGTASVNVPQNQMVNTDFLLQGNPATVQGVVRDQTTGAILPNTLIRLFNTTGVLLMSIQTDASGFYQLTGFNEGQYQLISINSNYQRAQIGFSAGPGETVTVNFDLVPEPGTIIGKITDQTTNSSIVGALVQIFIASQVDPIARTLTGNDGQFSISGLAPNTYTVVASANSYSQNSTGGAVLPNQTTTTNLSLAPNPAAMNGTVTDLNGDTVSNATVKVIDVNNVVIGTAVTNTNGFYSISNLPAGIFSVLVSAPGFANGIGGVTLERGQTMSMVDFVLTPNPGSITGTITEQQTGETLKGISVNIVNPNGITVRTVTSDQNGQYTVTSLAPGSYTVIGSKTGFSTNSVGAVVTSGQTTTSDLVLSEDFGAITGTVIDQNGNPITGISVTVRLFSSNGVILQTILAEPDGTFTFTNLSPERYVLNVIADDFQTAVVPIAVQSDQTTQITIPLQRNTGTVTGSVVNADTGISIEGALLAVTSPNGTVLATGVSGTNGNFAIMNLPPGSLNITATKNGFGTDSKGVIVIANSVVNTVLSLEPNPGKLQGTIVNSQTKNAIPGATVQAIDNTGAVVATVLSDSNGGYGLFNLAPGLYQVSASAVNFDTQLSGVAINQGGTTTNNFFLNPQPGNLVGRITNGLTGQAISGASVTVRTLGPSGPVVATALTDSNGRYVVDSLPPGVYTIVASKPAFGTGDASQSVNSNETSTQNLILFPNPSSVQGTVTSVSTGEPLPSTLIRLISSGGGVIKEVQTDINGNYLIQQFNAGTLSVVALNPDFSSQIKSFTVEPGERATVNFQLTSDPGTLKGTVTDAVSGTALGGGAVILFEQNNRTIANTVTDNQGHYQITGIQPGTYTVRASALRHAAQAKTVVIRSNQTTTANFALPRNPVQISGVVTNQNDIPLFNASVSVFDANGLLIGRGLAGPDGHYVIGNLPSGNLTLIASAPGYNPVTKQVSVSPGDQVIVNFQLGLTTGSLQGTVTNGSTGSPIQGATLTVRESGPAGPIVATTSTNANGHYTVSGLKPAVYTIIASKSGFGSADASQQITAGQTATQDFNLFPSHSNIKGTVTAAATGKPLANTTIRLINSGGTVVRETTTGSDGTYSFRDIASGSFTVVALNPSFQSQTNKVNVKPSETVIVNFSLKGNPGTLQGTVRDRVSGYPISGATVILYNRAGEPITSVTTTERGSYEILGIQPGNYTVRATANRFVSDSQQATIFAGEVTVVNFKLGRNPATLSGIITGDVPLRNASVTVFDRNDTIIGRGLSDLNGEYFIGNLPSGRFRVTASAPGFFTQTETANLTAGRTTIVNFSLQPNGTAELIGKVIDAASGDPVKGASVTLKNSNGQNIRTITTDENGRFSFVNLIPGTYKLIVSAPEFESKTVSVTLTAGQTKNLTIFLTRKVTPSSEPKGLLLVDRHSSQPVYLFGSTFPTVFKLVRIDRKSNSATLIFRAPTKDRTGTVELPFITDLSQYNLIILG